MNPAGPSRTYTVERADLDRDKEAVLAVWARNIPGLPFPDRRYEWEYVRNPSGQALCWFLVANPGQHRVGTCSVVLRRMLVAGHSATVGRASLLAVDAAHRFLGPAVILARAVLGCMTSDGINTVFTVAPAKAASVARRVGYTDLGTYVRHAKVLDATPHLEARLGAGALSRLLTGPVNLALRALSRDTWAHSARFELRRIETFDERFDNLWGRVRGQYETTTERTASFLRWRFDQCPYDTDFVTLGVVSRDDERVVGYVVFAIEGTQVNIYDLVCEPASRALDVLLAGLVSTARRSGAATLSCLYHGPGWLEQAMHRFGLRLRHDEPVPTVLMIAPPAIGTPTESPAHTSRWCILPADNF